LGIQYIINGEDLFVEGIDGWFWSVVC